MTKENILGLSNDSLSALFDKLGEKPYRGKQLYRWLYSHHQPDFELMTDLPTPLRDRLAEYYAIEKPTLKQKVNSSDGTKKFLLELTDKQQIEMVLIPDHKRGKSTVCISSQAGCALGCEFCATGTLGLKRNLEVGEIIGQLLLLRELAGFDSFINVVFMGMGEPLSNYDNLVSALQIMTDPLGLGLGSKRITVSTVGMTPKIRRLADSGLKVRLALSLHAATQEKREIIMPIARTFSLDKLIESVRYYVSQTNDRVSFEYMLIDRFNDSMEDVHALAKLVRDISCKINLLAYNPVPGLDFKRPTDEKVDWFASQLHPLVSVVTVRQSRGCDINAACGQLAARSSNEGIDNVT